MMNTARLLNLTRHPELLDRETLYELRNSLSRYPYFTAARILYLHNLYLLHEPSFNKELKRAALQVNDRSRLFQIIEGHKYAPVPNTPVPNATNAPVIRPASTDRETNPAEKSRTLDLINQFLSQQPEKETLVPFDLTVDYTTYLLEESEKQPQDSPTQTLIDSYLRPSFPKEEEEEEEEKREETAPPPEAPRLPAEEPALSSSPEIPEKEAPKEATGSLDESFFTETLAKIYIKQGRYDKALEIIKNIYLKNPKKSAYFADQIRFLEKLIINSK